VRAKEKNQCKKWVKVRPTGWAFGVYSEICKTIQVVHEDKSTCKVPPRKENTALNTKAKGNAKSRSNATDSCIISAGEIFADGSMIELIAGSSVLNKPDVLLWNSRKATVGARVKHGGCIYEAPELAPSLYRATRLPSRCGDYGSARGLFAAITDLFRHHLDLPERESSLLACFSISTWLADRLPTAPNLIISGPDEEVGIDVLYLLSCVCRHPLKLAELTPGSFRSLPMHLSLTLLLDQQRLKPNVQRLFRASSHRGLHLPGNTGSVVDLYGPKAIFCGNDSAVDILSGGAIQIFLAPSQLQSSALDEQVQNEIATRFQPRLLMYRLKNSGKVRESRVDVSEFTFTTRRLASTLAGCFPEDEELARDTVELLRPQDEEVRERRSRDLNCVIVEILWRIVHDGDQRAVGVKKLAGGVNTLLWERGEIWKYSPETIGWKLRTLQIPRHTSSLGQQVLLGRDTSQTVHRLARAYDLPCAQHVEAGCPDCSQAQVAVSE
jgi:hypothetical protein